MLGNPDMNPTGHPPGATAWIAPIISSLALPQRKVINDLLKPTADESPSPYAARALTRDPESERAREITNRGIQVFAGGTNDLSSVLKAMIVGEENEVYTRMRIFEFAIQFDTLEYRVWSGLVYSSEKGDTIPSTDTCTTTARVRAQPSAVDDDGMSWSILSTMVYMEMPQFPMLGPLHNLRLCLPGE
ncbi:hypothetical protein C8Q73DRAFT_789453 [Cubamyces lactineus]|nr:hypothetical protein C8Q73DRAFT_789453 [Cubamyces lactineus]